MKGKNKSRIHMNAGDFVIPITIEVVPFNILLTPTATSGEKKTKHRLPLFLK